MLASSAEMRPLLRLLLSVSGFGFALGACGDDEKAPLVDGGGAANRSGSSSASGSPGEAGNPAGGEGGGAAGGGSAEGGAGSDAGGAPPEPCNQGKGATISGRVLSPSGALPLAGVTVYVPSATVDPPPSGAGCFRCASAFGGVPVARAVTDADGRFEVIQAPAGAEVPLVVQTGKWRRQLSVSVTDCQDNPTEEDATRLPRSRAEGHLPAIALVSGGEDTLECLLRKLGIADEEFAIMPDAGRVRLFQGKGGIAQLSGVPESELPTADLLWSSTETLGVFDLVLLGSEPDENVAAKPQAALDAMRAYALAGGRVFAQHFQSYFLSAGPQDVASVATYVAAADLPSPFGATVDESSARGQALAASLLAAEPEASRGSLAIQGGKRWVSAVQAPAVRLLHGETPATVQAYSVDLPVAPAAACGRITHTDLLTAAGDTIADFPGGCTSEGWSAQERALAYLIFDLGACLP